jgi:hypothetical protein
VRAKSTTRYSNSARRRQITPVNWHIDANLSSIQPEYEKDKYVVDLPHPTLHCTTAHRSSRSTTELANVQLYSACFVMQTSPTDKTCTFDLSRTISEDQRCPVRWPTHGHHSATMKSTPTSKRNETHTTFPHCSVNRTSTHHQLNPLPKLLLSKTQDYRTLASFCFPSPLSFLQSPNMISDPSSYQN